MKFCKSCFCLLIALAMIFVLFAGCGEKEGENEGEEEEDGTYSYSTNIAENGFWENITAADYVQLHDYNSFTVPSDVHKITDDKVQDSIDTILGEYTETEEVTDRAVEDGDTVNIDYVGSIDGVEFSGGTTGGEGTDVTIGVTNYIDDFLEQIIGHEPGETFDVNVTFPEDYSEQNTELNGKDAVFVTTVNYIVDKVTPELTDEFVESKLSQEYEWKTVAEMKDGVYKKLQRAAIKKYIQEYLANEVIVESVPDWLMEHHEKAMIQYYQNYADEYEMEFEEFLNTHVKQTLDELIESNYEGNVKSAKYGLVIQAVAEKENITVTNENIAAHFLETVGSEDYSIYEEDYGLPYLKQVVLCENVLDYLIEHATLGE